MADKADAAVPNTECQQATQEMHAKEVQRGDQSMHLPGEALSKLLLLQLFRGGQARSVCAGLRHVIQAPGAPAHALLGLACSGKVPARGALCCAYAGRRRRCLRGSYMGRDLH